MVTVISRQNAISSASAKAAASVVASIAAVAAAAAAWGNFVSIFKPVADASMCLTQPTEMATSVELLQCLRSEYVG